MSFLSYRQILIRVCGLLLGLTPFWASPWIPAAEGAAPFAQIHVESLRREIAEEDLPGHDTIVDAGITRVTARVGLAVPGGWRFCLIGGGADLEIPDFDKYRGNGGVVYGLGVGRTDRRNFFDASLLAFTTDDQVRTTSGLQREEIRWTEYLLRAGLIYPMKRMEPFGGIRVSQVRGTDRLSGSGRLTFENRDNVGLFGGLNVPLTRAFSLTGEFSLLDEEGVRIRVGRDF